MIKKVIIWGHKLFKTNTHCFIHYGYCKAFKHMGYETHWFTDKDDVSNFNFNDCLFITAGDQEKNIPLNKNRTLLRPIY